MNNGDGKNILRHVYIHVPFCEKKCAYCSFYSVKYQDDLKEKYIKALYREIELFQEKYTIKPYTIYLGGGTPSLLDPTEIQEILEKFYLMDFREITIEANPQHLTHRYARDLKKTLVNRVSVGTQSFREIELKTLGRIHTARQNIKAYKNLRKAGFDNISLDFMYGLPGQTMDDVAISLQALIKLDPDHISTYCLSLDESVPLYSQRNAIPDDDDVAAFYDLIRRNLNAAFFTQYEISNFARDGKHSQHNMCYWSDKRYLGFGPAASGYVDQMRYANPDDVDAWCANIAENRVMPNAHSLSYAEWENEYIFLNLRKKEGIWLEDFERTFGVPFTDKYMSVLNKYADQLMRTPTHIFLRPEAYFVSNSLFTEFI
ncbi:MAG: radical SAM family heme chaperone HemW [Candidatus Cloacimonetes bacterium]|nr:radical SAM family heme chaperone HemW [Candidatus Cloacimonadota bacterium]